MRTMLAPNSESPRPIAAAIKNSDLMVNLGFHPMLHTDTMRAALAAGARYIAMPQLTVENLTHLRDLLASKNDKNSFAIGEFSIGTNPMARVTGNMSEDKRKEGTVHFGIGDNVTLGGTNYARIHLDGLILRPTVLLDGRVVVENGELRI